MYTLPSGDIGMMTPAWRKNPIADTLRKLEGHASTTKIHQSPPSTALQADTIADGSIPRRTAAIDRDSRDSAHAFTSYDEYDLPPRPQRRSLTMSLQAATRRLSSAFERAHTRNSYVTDPDLEEQAANIPPILRSVSQQSPAQQDVNVGTGPKNGRTAWIQALLAFLVVFNCWGWPNCWGLFQAYYLRDYLPGTSPGTIAWIGSTQVALCFGLGAPVGQAVDNGHWRTCFTGGSCLMIISLFTSSFCTSWISLWFVQGLLTGIGMGCLFTSGLLILLDWFDDRRIGLAMGLAAAGSCLGGIIFTLMARDLLPSYGFGYTMRVMTAVSLLTLILPNAFYKPRGQYRSGHRSEETHWRQRVRSLADLPYLLALAGMFFSFLGLYFGYVYIITFAVETLSLSDTAASNMLIFMLLANIPGRLIPAVISDRLSGPLNTIICCACLSSIVIWAWLGSTHPTQPAMTAIVCFYGLVSGGIQSLYAPASLMFCEQDNNRPQQSQVTVQERFGFKAGTMYSAIGLACLIGTPMGGALITYRTDNGLDKPFLGAQVIAGISMLLGGCLLTVSRVMKAGSKWRKI